MDSMNLPAILTPDLGLLFWMLIAFIIVFAVLAKFGFPVIVGMVEKRKLFIEESLKKAHEAAERLSNIQKESEDIVAKAHEQQAKIIKEASSTREAILEEAKAKAKLEAESIISEAKLQIEYEKQIAIREIKAQVAQLSVEIAEKVIRKQLDSDSDHMQLIERMLEDVKSE